MKILKFLLLQLIKNYFNRPQETTSYSRYFVGFFVFLALVLMIGANIVYADFRYTAYVGIFLKTSTAFLLAAVVIRLFSLWLSKKNKSREYTDVRGLSHLMTDFLPVVVSMIPMSIIAYIVWTKIQVKISGKNEQWKDSVKHWLL